MSTPELKPIVSPQGIELIKKFEGLSSRTPGKNDIIFDKDYSGPVYVYTDVVGIPTIGYGSTFLLEGTRVNVNTPPITVKQAEELLIASANRFAQQVLPLIKSNITQKQLDAIVCFVYNIGYYGFAGSTALKLINANPNDPSIKDWWTVWCKATKDGVMVDVPALKTRRQEEYEYYRTA